MLQGQILHLYLQRTHSPEMAFLHIQEESPRLLIPRRRSQKWTDRSLLPDLQEHVQDNFRKTLQSLLPLNHLLSPHQILILQTDHSCLKSCFLSPAPVFFLQDAQSQLQMHTAPGIPFLHIRSFLFREDLLEDARSLRLLRGFLSESFPQQ